MYTRILIPLDGSATAEQVLPYARTFARALKLPAELLAVVDTTALLTSVEKARRFDQLSGQEIAKGKAYLANIAKTFPERPHCTVEQGSAAEVIVDKAAEEKTTLIAMTTHGRSGLNRWLLGSVAEKVLRATTNPLLLVRAVPEGHTEGEATLKSVVVPLDGSELAERALPGAAEIATNLDAEAFLLRAYINPFAAFAGSTGQYAVNVDALLADVRNEARNYLEEKMTALKEQGIEALSYILHEGDAAEEIVSMANDMPESLIVMSSHGRSGLKRWILGSVAETVARHSNSPVLVVR